METEVIRGYLHVQADLFDNEIRFGRNSKSVSAGESLISFIYFDFKPLVNRLHYSIDDFANAHPYFKACSPQWQMTFVEHIEKNDENRYMPSLKDIINLQENYKNLLHRFFASQGTYDDSRIREKLSEDEWIRTQACFARMSVETEDIQHMSLDYMVSSLDECLMVEFIEVLRRKIHFKACKNCGKLFIPHRTNTDYCSRVFTPDGKTCAEVGYTQTFARNLQNDELLHAYTRAYKAHYARMTKPRKRVANMTREDFEAWYEEAKEKLELAREGLLPADEFTAWLKK